MPQGLQIWDASGALVLDTNTMHTRMVGVIQGPASGSISVPIFANGRPFAAVLLGGDGIYGIGARGTASVSGTTLTYNLQSYNVLLYGIY